MKKSENGIRSTLCGLKGVRIFSSDWAIKCQEKNRLMKMTTKKPNTGKGNTHATPNGLDIESDVDLTDLFDMVVSKGKRKLVPRTPKTPITILKQNKHDWFR